MSLQTVIGASEEPSRPDVRVDEARLLLGDWKWEPATSQLVGVVEEGPLGSVDLSLRVLQDLTEASRSTARRGLGQPASLGVHLSPPLWKRLAYLLQPPIDLLLDDAGPIEWPSTLFPYQVDGVRTLLARDAILLADDTGLGKTVEAIAALRILALQRRMQAALVVVPAGLLRQWRKAIDTWAPELRVSTIHGPAAERAWRWQSPAHVYLVSYDTLREDGPHPDSPPRRRTWDVVALDEAQRIKNRDADVSRVCKRLRRRRAWALTGTPLENNLDELASILEFVAPSTDAPPTRLFPGSEVIDRQRAVQLRRRKADVLPQLPPKLTSTITLQLGAEQRASYERAEREGVYALKARGADVHIQNVLELITRLKQLCNVDPVSGHSAKLADLDMRLTTLVAEGHRALVFTQFTDATFGARAIAARLVRLRPLLYTGDMSLAQRDHVIRAFKQDASHSVLVLSLRAGGVGLNLQDASYVFHFDRWWNPSVERQAEDRTHRLGQTYPVNVYTYTCEQTMEERIEVVLRRKRRLFQDIVDEVTLDLADVLTGTELFSLFGLPVPPAHT
ncbi:MAG: DEAD/DEAH box helicase [Chloroflexota bacterium]|nr:DEAD/DEAH box helicase [Chloroflexota bacterium]